ncbi:hypothetical protein QAD02_005044 [Eretmocerus hayati]|uniref:Uncharacterized protein n=1 Tax=Eretmocerus hayati TaxID=131215 RepID=A0ACC2NU69_9HYME|nr:hypothetical protein QAD02_005044 [Eretmocerus hayati]
MDLKNSKRRYFGSTRDTVVAREGRQQWWKMIKRRRTTRVLSSSGQTSTTHSHSTNSSLTIGNNHSSCASAGVGSGEVKAICSPKAKSKEGSLSSTHSTHASKDLGLRSTYHVPVTTEHESRKGIPETTAVITATYNAAGEAVEKSKTDSNNGCCTDVGTAYLHNNSCEERSAQLHKPLALVNSDSKMNNDQYSREGMSQIAPRMCSTNNGPNSDNVVNERVCPEKCHHVSINITTDKCVGSKPLILVQFGENSSVYPAVSEEPGLQHDIPHESRGFEAETADGCGFISQDRMKEDNQEPSEIIFNYRRFSEIDEGSDEVPTVYPGNDRNPLLAKLYSSDSDDDDQDGDPGHSDTALVKLFEPIQVSNEVTPAALLRMVFKHFFKNKLSFSGIVDNARMINMAVSKRALPDTRYLFDKLCNNRVEYTSHAVCPECSGYAGIFVEAAPTVECENCNFEFEAMHRSDACYFGIIDPSEAIRDLLQLYEEHYDYVVNHKKHDPNHFLKKLPASDRFRYVTAAMNLDGVLISGSSNLSMTPLYLMINELPLQARLKHLVLGGLWAGARQPVMNIFLD